MNSKEARQTTRQVRLNNISTLCGSEEYATVVSRISAEAKRGGDFIKSTILTRYAKEVEYRLLDDGFKCQSRPIEGDYTVSIMHVEW